MQGASLLILHYYSLGLVPSKGRAQTLQAMELDPKPLQKRGYTEPNTKWTAVNVSYLNRNAVSAECSAQNLHFVRLIYLYWSYLNIIQPFAFAVTCAHNQCCVRISPMEILLQQFFVVSRTCRLIRDLTQVKLLTILVTEICGWRAFPTARTAKHFMKFV